jgi:hypothetical protein
LQLFDQPGKVHYLSVLVDNKKPQVVDVRGIYSCILRVSHIGLLQTITKFREARTIDQKVHRNESRKLVCCGKMLGILSDTGSNEISLIYRSSIDLKMLAW